ncbi:MAG: class I SAM-dependent methyltransferase [Thermomicrobiales bacterium]
MSQEGAALARATFTTQAASYAASAVVADRERRRQFVAHVAPAPDARVLDVATGPGFTALAFAERAGFVLGLDLTPAMLVQARQARDAASAMGLQFVLGEATALPVASGAFDVVGCGNAVHHFAAPLPPLREFARACRPGGQIAISDLTTDEDPQRAAEHNAIERLRDPSHVCSYPPSELAALLTSLSLVVRSVETTTRRRGLAEWLAIAKTPPERAAAVRERLLASLDDDRTGLAPAWEDGQLCFTHTTAWLIAAKPESA